MADIQLIRGSNGNGPAVRPVVTAARSSGSLTIKVNSTTNLPPRFIGTWGKLNQETGKLVSNSIRDFYGAVNGADIDLVQMASGFADDGNEAGDVIVIKPNTDWTHNLADIIQKHDDDLQGTITARDELFADSVVRGTGGITTVSGREASISNITYYMSGIRLTKTGIPNKTFTATKDTYCYIDTLGAVSYVEVANNAAAPTTPANSIPFAKVTTNASAITSVVLMGRGAVGSEQIVTDAVGIEQVNFAQMGVIALRKNFTPVDQGTPSNFNTGNNSIPDIYANVVEGYTYRIVLEIGLLDYSSVDIVEHVIRQDSNSGAAIIQNSGTTAKAGRYGYSVTTGYYKATSTVRKRFVFCTSLGGTGIIRMNQAQALVECVGKPSSGL